MRMERDAESIDRETLSRNDVPSSTCKARTHSSADLGGREQEAVSLEAADV